MIASENKEQVRPLAIATPSPSIYVEEDPFKWQPSRRKLFNRGIILCSGFCVASLAIVGVVLLVVALTVYKVRELEITMNSITIHQMHITPPSINMTLTADVSVVNPNVPSFQFYSSETTVHYRDALEATAFGPKGMVPGHGTIRMNLTVDVFVTESAGDLRSGDLVLDSSTRIGGYVRILGTFRHVVDVIMKCTMTVDVAGQSILNRECWQLVRE